MTIGDAVKERLLAMTPLTTLVNQRVYETVLPQNEKRTAVRFFVLGAPRPKHIRGPINQFSQRVQVDSYVPIGPLDPLSDCKAIAAAVMGNGLGPNASGLFGWQGYLVGSPPEIHIFDVEVTADDQSSVEMDEIRRVRIRQEYRVHWRAA